MTLEIHFLDVGQGDCTVLLFKEGDTVIRSVVIDCGGTNAFGKEEQEDVQDGQQSGEKLLKFFRTHQIARFDIWIITHWDKDHFGGFNHVLRTAKSQESIRAKLINLHIYDRGECFNYDVKQQCFKSGSFNKKTPYVTFRGLLSDLTKRHKDLKLERSTELVYGNANRDREKFELGDRETLRFINAEPDRNHKYRYLAPDFLIGEDLLNLGFKNPIDAKLECLVVNGYCLDEDGTHYLVSLDQPKTDKENCRSMGLLLTFGDFSCWFGGDLESQIEDELIPVIQARIGKRPLSVLKAGHHGSYHSTSDNFINQLQPDTVIVSSPPESRLHPHPELLKRLAENKWIKAVYLTGCRPYVGEDQKSDSHDESTVIEGIDTNELLGLSGELIPSSTQRKFYVCGGTEHATNQTYNGDICVKTEEDRTRTKQITYWEAFGELVLSRRNSESIKKSEQKKLKIDEVVDDFGNLHRDIFVDHDETWSKSIRITNRPKKRKLEILYDIKGLTMTQRVDTKRQRIR